MPVLECRTVRKDYRLGKTSVTALSDVTFSIERGVSLTLMGPSGSGKSTLLHLLGLIDTPTGGEIMFNGNPVGALSEHRKTILRRESLGFIFQSFHLIPVLSVRENIEYPLQNSRLSSAERSKKSRRLIEETGLEGLERRRPGELSGGQRQRVAVARALIRSPEIILADEPTANLDSQTGKMIIDLLRRLSTENGTTVILATHDPYVIGSSERIIHVRDGRISENEPEGATAHGRPDHE